MKIRQGFVSNSSSSSFVILIPTKFDINQITNEEIDKTDIYDCEEYINENDEIKYDKVREDISESINGGDLYEYDNGLFRVVEELMNKYIISSFDVSSDGGSIQFVKQAEIEEKLKNL